MWPRRLFGAKTRTRCRGGDTYLTLVNDRPHVARRTTGTAFISRSMRRNEIGSSPFVVNLVNPCEAPEARQ
jgi:hypothetical protein